MPSSSAVTVQSIQNHPSGSKAQSLLHASPVSSPQTPQTPPHPSPHTPSHNSSLINIDHCQRVFDFVLSSLYPCLCECGGLCTTPISTRAYSLRCPKCLRQKSKLSHTPFVNLRIPQWMCGWLLEESFIRHPKVVTSSEIVKKLGVSEKTALLMKRRVQLLASEQMEKMRILIREELHRAFPPEFKLPPDGENVTASVQNKPVVHMDTLALFSASQRANQGRKRHKNKGLTSSIFMSEKLGGRQIGVLAQVMGTQGGWCVAHSVPDQKAGTLGPLVREWLPHNTALFSDEMYTWLYRIYPNHRMINHSLKSKDSRYKFSRERWSRNGVNSQIAEGLNGSLKTGFRNYGYVRPQYSQLYLNEWCFWKNVRYFGMERLKKCGVGGGSISPTPARAFHLQTAVRRHHYRLPQPQVVRNSNRLRVNGKIDPALQRLLDSGSFAALADAITRNDTFWSNPNKVHQRVKERMYHRVAMNVWQRSHAKGWSYLSELGLDPREKKQALRVIRAWKAAGLIELQDLTPANGKEAIEYGFRKLLPSRISLPSILYRQTRTQYASSKE